MDEELAGLIREFRSPADDETRMFYEMVIAPGYTPEGLKKLKGKSKTLRILEAKPRAPEGQSLRQIAGKPPLTTLQPGQNSQEGHMGCLDHICMVCIRVVSSCDICEADSAYPRIAENVFCLCASRPNFHSSPFGISEGSTAGSLHTLLKMAYLPITLSYQSKWRRRWLALAAGRQCWPRYSDLHPSVRDTTK